MLRNICQKDDIREETGIEREEASTDEKMDDTFRSYYTRFRAAILSQTERGMAFMTTESETTIFCARALLAITKQAWGGIRQKKQATELLIANEKRLSLPLITYARKVLHRTWTSVVLLIS